LRDVDLTIAPGEVLALLGASGSGKSTLLNVVAGLLRPARGDIWIDGVQVAGQRVHEPPERRSMGMVFQNFALWPHLSVIDTVSFPLRRAGRSRRDSARAATILLAQLGIEHLADRRPAELSGGEQQRVGLARALARQARLYLLDEPTAHLDTHLRAAFLDSVVQRQRDTGAAAIYATHDCAEALALADRVALVEAGRVIQVDNPTAVYMQPVSLAAAVLTGPCSVLTVDGRAAGDGRLALGVSARQMQVSGGGIAADDRSCARRTVIVRPDWVHVGGSLPGRVAAVLFRGPHTDYVVESDLGRVLLSIAGPPQHRAGDPLTWSLDRSWVVPAGPSTIAGTELASAERDDRPGPAEPVVDDVEMQPGVVP
jgi:ABC-type sugar transport system ATPase subunit